jgi:hypothetical protein
LVYFRSNNESQKVEREGYSLFDLFGDLGGVIEILSLLIGVFVDRFASFNMISILAKTLFTSNRRSNENIVDDRAEKDIYKKLKPIKCLII